MSSSKRKQPDDFNSPIFTNKSRARSTGESIARIDPTYGQKFALPGLDKDTREDDGDSLNYDEETDAISYLMSVRQEASSIPNLLVAPKDDKEDHNIYESGASDHIALYKDGAYYAAPSSDNEDESSNHDNNIAYFDSILARFEILRIQLQQTPPAELIAQLGPDHPTYIGTMNTATARLWRWKMKNVNPKPAQVATMDKRTVLKLLGLITSGNLLRQGTKTVDVGASRWAWSLLARLPERGELTSEEIGMVRELGKKAVLVGMGLKIDTDMNEGIAELEGNQEGQAEEGEGDIAVVNDEEIDLEEDEEDGEVDLGMSHSHPPQARDLQTPIMKSDPANISHGTPEKETLTHIDDAGILPLGTTSTQDELAAAKAQMLQALDNPTQDDQTDIALEKVAPEAEETPTAPDDSDNWNTKATIDMILTVAGEIFGQRDLLEFRQIWDQVG
ncbi:hypothetical protein HYALB_00003928 [Hymenoscyphus albidus]|uniref:Uncharacterized protein n=1 Tax=Hymenoscyphus albidus TaxID=595503 RepID=A0A9N9Q9Q4_9HELO|nr:hypothetical protein HYALB_00003928 [Hymenoscyphus albidus]